MKRKYSPYRKIYEQHYGPIPIDEDGRTYEIHHIDGDHTNNDPSNLKAVTLQEHYRIHEQQGDWAACYLMMTQRMDKTPEEISEMNRLAQLKKVEDGTHPWLGDKNPTVIASKNGTHHWFGNNNPTVMAIAAGTHPCLGLSLIHI